MDIHFIRRHAISRQQNMGLLGRRTRTKRNPRRQIGAGKPDTAARKCTRTSSSSSFLMLPRYLLLHNFPFICEGEGGLSDWGRVSPASFLSLSPPSPLGVMPVIFFLPGFGFMWRPFLPTFSKTSFKSWVEFEIYQLCPKLPQYIPNFQRIFLEELATLAPPLGKRKLPRSQIARNRKKYKKTS